MTHRSPPRCRGAPSWKACVGIAMLSLSPLALSAADRPVEGVAFRPPPDAALPRATAFADENGRRVRLSDYLGTRPTLIVPAYYGCSNLCDTVLSGIRASLDAAHIRAARDVDVLVVSISPLDTVADAHTKKQAILGEAGDARGWHFLTGNEEAIAELTAALGYRYRYDAEGRQYAHAAGIAVAAPDGRIRSVLYGIALSPQALRSALAERADDVAVEADARNWLLCFHYDPRTGRYSFAAMNAVRAAGFLALLALVSYVARARLRERRTARGHSRR